jgi:hypothetical protein
LAPEYELGFPFALRHRSPGRKRGGQHDAHHAECHEQRRHRIAALRIANHGRRICVLPIAVLPSTVRTVTVTVYVPAAVYTWAVVLPDVVTSSEPSPKSQVYDWIGAVVVPSPPPVTVAVNVQRRLSAVVPQLSVIETLIGDLGVMITVVETAAVSPLTSTASTVAVYVLGVELDGPA